MTKNVEKNYQEFWKNIIEPKGKFSLEQVKKELSDYHFLLEEVPKVYDKITGGRLSYPNYHAHTALSMHEEKFLDKDCTQCDIKDMINNSSDFLESKKELRKYFDITND